MIKKKLDWLEIARELQSMGQTGLAFTENNYDIERYERLIEMAAEITADNTEHKKEELNKVFMEQPGYATPKIDVRAAVIEDGKILLVKEISDGKWAMPGGWADVGDIPSEVAERETEEESGYIVKAKELVGVFDANRVEDKLEFFHAFKLIFLCELNGGEARISSETSDVRFFDLDKLPEFSMHRTNQKHINEILTHLEKSNKKAYFD